MSEDGRVGSPAGERTGSQEAGSTAACAKKGQGTEAAGIKGVQKGRVSEGGNQQPPDLFVSASSSPRPSTEKSLRLT